SASSSCAPVAGSASGQASPRVPTSSATRAKYSRLIVAPLTAFASCLVFKAYLFNDDAFVGRLAHVVDGQRRHAGGGHGFHFDAGFVVGAAGGAHFDGMGGVVEREIDPDEGQRQAVAQRDELGAALGGQHGGHARRVEDFALALAGLGQQAVGEGVHAHRAARDGDAVAGGFCADVDHADLAGFVQVTKGGRRRRHGQENVKY